MDEKLKRFDQEYQGKRKTAPSSDRTSDEHPLLRRLVALMPQRGEVWGGESKACVHLSASKAAALNLPYVTLNGRFLAVMRVDVDRSFASWAHLRDEIADSGLLPCLPNLVVGTIGPDGRRVANPHLLFFLPPGSEVWADPTNPRCRKRPVRLWHAVLHGLTTRLAGIGADPGGLANPLKIKNPLSPSWDWMIFNADQMPVLSEWADWVDLSVERKATPPGGADEQGSNNVFVFMTGRAMSLAQALAASPRAGSLFGDNRLELESLLYDDLRSAIAGMSGMRDPRGQTARRVASFTAEHFDLAKHRGRTGKLRNEVAHLPVRERQAAAGRFAATERKRKAFEKLLGAARGNSGEPLKKFDAGRLAGVTRPTVDKHWAGVEDSCHQRREYLKLQDYGLRAGSERPPLVDFMLDEFMSYEQSRFMLDLSSLPEVIDCDAHCNGGQHCVIEHLAIEKAGFPPDGLACNVAKSARPAGRLLIRVRDYTSDERSLGDP